MGESAEVRRTAAVCLRCEKAYAAEIWPDGSIRPIGQRAGCSCGSTEFDLVET